MLQVKRKKSPVSDDGDDENGVKDEDNDWEESGDSPEDDDDDFKPVAKKSKKSVSDGENCIFKNDHYFKMTLFLF